MSSIKLLVLFAFIGLSFTALNLTPCGNNQISKYGCANTLMSYGSYCCFLNYTDSLGNFQANCYAFEMHGDYNKTYYEGQIEKEEEVVKINEFFCLSETEYIPNNCGAVGTTEPQSTENCTYARIPEQHCCLVKYNVSDSTTKSVCRSYAEFTKVLNEEVKNDIESYKNETITLDGDIIVDCSKVFIKMALLNVFVIMIALI